MNLHYSYKITLPGLGDYLEIRNRWKEEPKVMPRFLAYIAEDIVIYFEIMRNGNKGGFI